MYEFPDLTSQADYEAIKNILPFFEGIKVYFTKHIGVYS